MANVFNRQTITNAGKSLLQAAQAGLDTVTIKSVVLGSGSWNTTEDMKSATTLKNQKNSYPISSKDIDESGNLKIKAVLTNASGGASIVPTSYRMNEIGIVAAGSDNIDILYAICANTSGGDEMPAYNGSNLVEITQELMLVIGDADVTVNVSGAYALAEDLEDHEELVVFSTDGVHGIRSVKEDDEYKLQVYDNGWKDAGGGGTEIVPIPVQNTSATYTYNGSEQSISWTSVPDTSKILVTGATATNAGTYTCTCTLKGNNAIWSDMTSAPKTFTWTIGKATPTITVSPASISFDKTHTSAVSLSVTTDSDGAVTLTGYDTDLITVTGASSPYSVATKQKTGDTDITVTVGASTNYLSASDTVSVSAVFTTIYGAEWDGTSTTAWSRTDASALYTDPSPAVNNGDGSSPFDDKMPWSGIEVVNDPDAGKLVKIPKFWYKWTFTGSKIKLQIADGEADGFSVSPAHADKGDGKGERDYVYVGAYHCASTFKSTTGVKPHANITRDAFRTGIKNLGTGIYQWDYAMLETIWMLYLVEYADWNSQAKIGYGCGNNSGTENMGSTDGMQYHTGTNAENRTTYGHVRYRYIEDLWGNVYDWCDGIYFSGADIYCIKNPASFSDGTGGTKVGTRPTTSNFISAWAQSSVSGFEYFIYPSAVAGSDSTYTPDYCSYYASGVVLRVGGNYNQDQDRGLFCLDGSNAASSASASIGSRLQKLP